MRTRQLDCRAGQRSYAIDLEAGDEAVACLMRFASEHGIMAARLAGSGALKDALVSFFDWQICPAFDDSGRSIGDTAIIEGDIRRSGDGMTMINVQVVLGRTDATGIRGRLAKAYLRPTLRLELHETAPTVPVRSLSVTSPVVSARV